MPAAHIAVVCAAALLFAPSAANAATDAPPMLDNWLANLAFVLGIIYMIVKTGMMLLPKPPNHRQFSAIEHSHIGYVTDQQRRDCRDEHTREMLTIRQEFGGMTGKLERQLDHVRNSITTSNDEISKKIGDGLARMHSRLDPIQAAVAANTISIENHLADHRAKKHGE